LAAGTPPHDPFLTVAMKRADVLTAAERAFVVGHFFSLNRDAMAVGMSRFHELAMLRGDAPAAAIGPAVTARFDVAALRDLQVLFHVAWSGSLLQADPLVSRLRAKGRGFTEDDKTALFAHQQEFLAGVLPRWQRLYDSGRVELSVTPYFHPILPLLCDLASAREALPDLTLPRARFQHAEDADVHLAMGMDAFERTFGRRAAGGWPSEGAISEKALERMAAAGYRWAGSDEDVLFASLGEILPSEPEAMQARRAAIVYRPWRHANGPVLLFRDHDLSDRIGFNYSGRTPGDAARDFVGRLLHIRDTLPDDGAHHVVSVILDGENAWEHYPDHATPFFDALYGALESEPGIRMVTATEAADPARAAVLPRVVAGSWIYRNLATWCGHPEKNRAWELLAAARDAVAAAHGAPRPDDPAWRAILAAEGSDWFWWYGDDHPTAYGAEFDAAFRGKLRAAYTAAGLDEPVVLEEPVRKASAARHTLPSGPVHARLDGRVTDYFEWRRAGHVPIVHGAMHAAVRFAQDLAFGSDGTTLYLRIDPNAPGALAGLGVTVRTPAGDAAGVTTAVDRVLEIAVPLSSLAAPGEPVRFAVELRAPSGAAQRVPPDGFIDLPPPEADPSRFDWSV
jgi:alpha-amylase/alpha-mannosidase (GH57 family)